MQASLRDYNWCGNKRGRAFQGVAGNVCIIQKYHLKLFTFQAISRRTRKSPKPSNARWPLQPEEVRGVVIGSRADAAAVSTWANVAFSCIAVFCRTFSDYLQIAVETGLKFVIHATLLRLRSVSAVAR
jgi:hypothetical protein